MKGNTQPTGATPPNVLVELTPQEAEQFKLFCKHYENFCRLLNGGVFNIKSKSVVLRINFQGYILKIQEPVPNKTLFIHRKKLSKLDRMQ